MASNTIITSTDAEKRWVQELDNCFLPPEEHMITVDFGTAASVVFRVPEMMSKTKPEAYAPQHLGLGPYHHFRPDLYRMHKQKVAAVREFLHQKDQLRMFKQVVDCLVQSEEVIRACYDEYLDLDIQTIARILAIDCLYFLHFFLRYSATRDVDDPRMEEFGGDIFMLENQIPLVLLIKVVKLLHNHFDWDSSLLLKKIDDLFLAQSPLQLIEQAEVTDDRNIQAHLLQRMLFLIVNNRNLIDSEFNHGPKIKPQGIGFPSIKDFLSTKTGFTKRAIKFLEQLSRPGALPQAEKIISSTIRLISLVAPQEKEPKVNIPSASEITEKDGTRFSRLTCGGIQDIVFDIKFKNFYLPSINLKPTSEIVLRNLLAFEAVSTKPDSRREFAEYVDLMCGIIDTKKDVNILKEAKIIQGNLSDEEIVGIFKGVAKSIGNDKESWRFSVEVASCGSASLKIFKVIITIVVIVLFTLQGYCSMFGCSLWFGKSIVKFQILHSDW